MVTGVVAGRVRFRDVKPCHAPTTLDALRGPYHGLIDLPHGVRWQEDRVGIDVDHLGGRRMAYQALLTEGRVAEQERLLNRDRLIELWPVINLDQRVRDLWETRFPELRVRT